MAGLAIQEVDGDAACELLGVPPSDGLERWAAVLEEDGEPVGMVFLSRGLGSVFGHDMACESKDPNGALMLFSRARLKAKEWGATAVLMHVAEGNERMRKFYEGQGFYRVMVVYQGDI